jgi:hypothetical protein
MPRALEPNRTFDIWLDSDAAKPAETRPTFIGRVLSGRDEQRILELSDSLQRAEDNLAARKAVIDSIALTLSGWRNMNDPDTGEAIPYSEENLSAVLCVDEALELLGKVRTANHLEVDDLGNSGSPSSLLVDGSAESADQAAASNGQPSRSRSACAAPDAKTGAAANCVAETVT